MTRASPAALRVIAVCNRKGGAGKTTTPVNLAAELAQLGWRVLPFDLDSQGHYAAGLPARRYAPSSCGAQNDAAPALCLSQLPA